MDRWGRCSERSGWEKGGWAFRGGYGWGEVNGCGWRCDCPFTLLLS